MKTLEKAVRTVVIKGKNWKQELFTFLLRGRRGGLLVNALDSGWSGPCCVLGQATLLSQCLSPPISINGYQKMYCWGNPAMDQHPIQEGVEILLVASCC